MTLLGRDEMFILTIYKRNGSRRKLDNYGGVSIVMILQLVYEKVSKDRIIGTLEENMSKFRIGGSKGKSVTDNLFIPVDCKLQRVPLLQSSSPQFRILFNIPV